MMVCSRGKTRRAVQRKSKEEETRQPAEEGAYIAVEEPRLDRRLGRGAADD